MCRRLLVVVTLFLLTGSCESDRRPQPPVRPQVTPPAPMRPGPRMRRAAPPRRRPVVGYTLLPRGEFNQLAARLNLPLFWRADANHDHAVDPGEVVALLFYPDFKKWADRGRFTRSFAQAYRDMVVARNKPVIGATPAEKTRRTLVRREMDQGRPTLVYNDFSQSSAQEKQFIGHMLRVASLIDGLYATQLGLTGLRGRIPADDPASRSLFRRNWGPDCKAPLTEKAPACTAIPGVHKVPVDLYPKDLQKQAGFCKSLAALPQAKALMAPFVVVRRVGGQLKAVPYSQAYRAPMEAVAKELEAAVKALPAQDEAPLKRYLTAAARAFRTNRWRPADEAWAKMSALSSKWYVRVAPDETYWEPCSQKAGFHLTFARINRASLSWQRKLVPVRQVMENEMAALIGPPYRPRTVRFKLPDFIDIVLNAGDDRNPFGATIGQSLPNWGPVANEGRGRTVAMSNLYTDPDSRAIRRQQAASLLSRASMAHLSTTPDAGLLNTILHEACHNFGPAHEYRVRGKKDTEIFGGPLATTLEELKAQTGGLWLVEFLRKRRLITDAFARTTYVDAFLWALGHISRGMFTASGRPRPYSQLAAIQVGHLLATGAVTFDPRAQAANDRDPGAFTLHLDKFPAAFHQLMTVVGRIKARGDKAGAEALVNKYVTSKVVPQALIKQRMLRYPKATFVYGVRL